MNDETHSQTAVSPVVGVILMVAVTVILSAVVGTFVFNLGQQTDNGGATNSGVQVTQTDDGVTVDTVTLGSTVEVRHNGKTIRTFNESEVGESLTLPAAYKGEKVTLVSISDSGEETVLTSYTVAEYPTHLSHWYHFNESTGSTAVDSLGDNNGTIHSGVSLGANGVSQNAYQFSGGTDSHVRLAQESLPANQPFTISIWMNVSSTSGTIYDQTKGSKYLYISYASGNVSWWYEDANDLDLQLNATFTNPTDGWHHIVVTGGWNQSQHALYLDGERVASSSLQFSGKPAFNQPQIGNETINYGSSYGSVAGRLDELQIFNSQLDQEEVLALCRLNAPESHPCMNKTA